MATSTKEIVDSFVGAIAARLDESKLDGPVRMDNTHTVVILPLKGKGPVHVHVQGGVDEAGVASVVKQIEATPSLKGLVKVTV